MLTIIQPSTLTDPLLDRTINCANAFLLVPRKLRSNHSWMNTCHIHRQVKQFLKSSPQFASSATAAIELATVAAKAYSLCGNEFQDTSHKLLAAEAKVIKGKAERLNKAISGLDCIPEPAKNTAFKAGLDALCEFYPGKKIKGDSLKGNPQRRAFILRIAEDFYRSFKKTPIAAITDLTSIGFPEILERTVRYVLTKEKIEEIQVKVTLEMGLEASANTKMHQIVNGLNRKILPLTVPEADLLHSQSFGDDEKLRMIINLLKGLADVELSRVAISAINEIATEFTVFPDSLIYDGGNENVDF